MSSPSTAPVFHPQTILPPRTLSSFIEQHPSSNNNNNNTTSSATSTAASTSSSSTTLPVNNAIYHNTIYNNTIYPNTTPTQAINMHTRRQNHVTRTTKPTLMTRLRGRHAKTRTVKTTTTTHPTTTTTRTTAAPRASRWGRSSNRRTAHHATAAPVVHHKRHATLGDKISGAMLKLKGSLTHRPAVKAAGTRRMHGTDGRGSHRVY